MTRHHQAAEKPSDAAHSQGNLGQKKAEEEKRSDAELDHMGDEQMGDKHKDGKQDRKPDQAGGQHKGQA